MRYFMIGKNILAILLLVVLVLPVASVCADEAAVPAVPEILYVVPFLNVMVPDTVSGHLFDSFIDQLMAAGEQHDMDIRILKQDIDTVDKEWLAKQHFITGELFGYSEKSGCCSTEIDAKARVYLYSPGSVEPAQEIVVPGEVFFDHDVTTLVKEHGVIADRMARELSRQLLADLISGR